MEYATNGKANAALSLGIIGTGLSALSGGLGNILGGIGGNNVVTKEVMDVQLQLIDTKRENAILSADLNTEKKIVETFQALNDKIMNVREEINTKISDTRKEQFDFTREVDRKVDNGFAAQAVINANTGSAVNLLQAQTAQLYTLTKLGIPNSSLCPGYGNVCVTPTGCGTITGTTNS